MFDLDDPSLKSRLTRQMRSAFKKWARIDGGSFGDVYEATRDYDGWKCVIKTLKENHTENDRDRFKLEVKVHKELAGDDVSSEDAMLAIKKSNVVPIIKHQLFENPPWYAMPRAEHTLSAYLDSHCGEDQLWIFRDIANGIRLAHSHEYIHRDLKPSNVLLFRHGQKRVAAVADFGICKEWKSDRRVHTSSKTGWGGNAYRPPELADFNMASATYRSDIYSLGKILFEILTQQTPIPGEFDLNRVEKKFRKVISIATDGDRKKRFRTVDEMLTALP